MGLLEDLLEGTSAVADTLDKGSFLWILIIVSTVAAMHFL